MNKAMSGSLRQAAIVLLVSVAVAGQGPKGPQGPNPTAPAGGSSYLNMALASTVSGKITAVQLAYGAQYPSITLDGKTIKIAPVWYMLENDFELAAGDEVRVVAAPSARPDDPSLHAVSITKVSSGATLTMRNDAGVPLWSASGKAGAGSAAGGGMMQNRGSQGTGCVDPSTITQAQGVIDAVSQGAGIQQPQLTLNSEGKSITLKIGPERLILAAGVELKSGMTLSVRYATASCTGELVALSLTDAAGTVVVLRNDDGTPAWN